MDVLGTYVDGFLDEHKPVILEVMRGLQEDGMSEEAAAEVLIPLVTAETRISHFAIGERVLGLRLANPACDMELYLLFDGMWDNPDINGFALPAGVFK